MIKEDDLTLLEVKLAMALELPILFHTGGPPNYRRWRKITGTEDMTTKVMCNHIRSVISEIELRLCT